MLVHNRLMQADREQNDERVSITLLPPSSDAAFEYFATVLDRALSRVLPSADDEFESGFETLVAPPNDFGVALP